MSEHPIVPTIPERATGKMNLPRRRPGLKERLALMLGLAIAPSAIAQTSMEDAASVVTTPVAKESEQRQEDEQHIEVIHQRIAEMSPTMTSASSSAEILPPSEVSDETNVNLTPSTEPQVEQAVRPANVGQMVNEAWSLFDPQHSAESNFSDVGDFIRTQVQDQRQAGLSSLECADLLRRTTSGVYERVQAHIEDLRTHGQASAADELTLAFLSWDPTSQTPETTQTVQDVDSGVSQTVTSSGSAVFFPSAEQPTTDPTTEPTPSSS